MNFFMEEARIIYLFTAYLRQTATPEELDEFFACVESRAHDGTLNALLDKHFQHTESRNVMSRADADAIVEAIFSITEEQTENRASILIDPEDPARNSDSVFSVSEERIKNSEAVHRSPSPNPFFFQHKRWMRYAAIFLLLAGAAAYFFIHTGNANESHKTAKATITDIPPGGNRATLTLADGSTILLDSAVNGDLAVQGGAQILKLQSGSLAYRPAEMPVHDGKILYNTIRTPRGGQYQVVLEDGTKVWLNAESSLRFPTLFEKERIVNITGEAYFEVAPNAKAPFRVKLNENTEIEVLGTAFNVNAYTDEATINTTLLSGSVRIKVNECAQPLAPGVQAQVAPNGDIKLVNPDIAGVIAWKNGAFSFNDADLPAVMRQLARWYNVQVEFSGAVPPARFNGEIGRDLTLSQVFNILTQTRVNYKIEEGRIIILP